MFKFVKTSNIEYYQVSGCNYYANAMCDVTVWFDKLACSAA